MKNSNKLREKKEATWIDFNLSHHKFSFIFIIHLTSLMHAGLMPLIENNYCTVRNHKFIFIYRCKQIQALAMDVVFSVLISVVSTITVVSNDSELTVADSVMFSVEIVNDCASSVVNSVVLSVLDCQAFFVLCLGKLGFEVDFGTIIWTFVGFDVVEILLIFCTFDGVDDEGFWLPLVIFWTFDLVVADNLGVVDFPMLLGGEVDRGVVANASR